MARMSAHAAMQSRMAIASTPTGKDVVDGYVRREGREAFASLAEGRANGYWYSARLWPGDEAISVSLSLR